MDNYDNYLDYLQAEYDERLEQFTDDDWTDLKIDLVREEALI